MTKKHLTILAAHLSYRARIIHDALEEAHFDILRESKKQGLLGRQMEHEACVDEVCNALRKCNPRFDETRFKDAALDPTFWQGKI